MVDVCAIQMYKNYFDYFRDQPFLFKRRTSSQNYTQIKATLRGQENGVNHFPFLTGEGDWKSKINQTNEQTFAITI